MSAGKLELVPKVASRIARSAAATATSMTSLDVWELAKVVVELAAAEVAEIYRPARFTSIAGSYGLRPSFFIDMMATREDGRHWDLRSADDQTRLKKLQKDEGPELLIGSPPAPVSAHYSVLANQQKRLLNSRSKARSTSGSASRPMSDNWRWAGTSCANTLPTLQVGKCQK